MQTLVKTIMLTTHYAILVYEYPFNSSPLGRHWKVRLIYNDEFGRRTLSSSNSYTVHNVEITIERYRRGLARKLAKEAITGESRDPGWIY